MFTSLCGVRASGCAKLEKLPLHCPKHLLLRSYQQTQSSVPWKWLAVTLDPLIELKSYHRASWNTEQRWPAQARQLVCPIGKRDGLHRKWQCPRVAMYSSSQLLIVSVGAMLIEILHWERAPALVTTVRNVAKSNPLSLCFAIIFVQASTDLLGFVTFFSDSEDFQVGPCLTTTSLKMDQRRSITLAPNLHTMQV